MLVLINATEISKENEQQFITFLEVLLTDLFKKNINTSFLVISLNSNLKINLLNCKTENIISSEKKNIIKSLINKIKISRVINKHNYDLIVNINTINSTEKQKQICILNNSAKPISIDKKDIKSSTQFLVFSELNETHLKSCIGDSSKVTKLNPTSILPDLDLSYTNIQQVKDGYAYGREYFLYDGNSVSEEDFINVLKSFSLFKKWQNSSMKLLILFNSNTNKEILQKKLENYKYKDDVVLVLSESIETTCKLVIAAYSLISYSSNIQFPTYISYAIANKVSVICGDEPTYKEYFLDTIMYAEKDNIDSLADKMKAIYKNENLKKELQMRAYENQNSNTKKELIETIEKIIFQNTN